MKNAGNSIYNCGRYLRLSREDFLKKDESSSISSQRLIITDFAKHNGLNIVEEYVDDGYSGGNFDRPGFSKMIEDIEKGKINCVITKDLSRLGREMYGTGRYIEEFFSEKNVRYIAINDSFDSLIGDSMLGIRLSVNDLYLRDVSKKVRTAFRVKQQNGEYIGTSPCYGYIKDPQDNHHLIIDEQAAKVVRYIFKLCLENQGGRSIANKLNALNIPSPNVYKKNVSFLKNHKNTYWTRATISHILKNRMYVGDMVQHTYEKVNYNSKKLRKVADKDIIIVSNTHDAIISREDFAKAQEMISYRHTNYNTAEEGKYLLSGLIHCGGCGRAMGISKNSKPTSKCSHLCKCNFYNRVGTNSGCTPNRVNYDYLESDILNYIKEIGKAFLKQYNTDDLLNDTVNSDNNNSLFIKKQIDETKEKLKNEEDKIAKIYDDRLEGVISTEMFTTFCNPHKEKIKELKEKINILERNYNDLLNCTENKDRFEICKRKIEEYIQMENPCKELLHYLIDDIVVYDHGEEKEVKVYFKFNELVNIANNLFAN